MLRTLIAVICGFVLVSSDAVAFEGNYARSGPQFRQSVVIKRNHDGTYGVKLAVKSRLCTGALDATGKLEGRDLVATVNADHDDCEVTISRHGATISVTETKCLNWHGAACDFNGTLLRR
jgi:hypothetical protein